MKKCSKCELNWIKDNEELCDVCLQEESDAKIPSYAELRTAIVKAKLLAGKSYAESTHADFLNTVFETDYKEWMQSTWKFSDNVIVWMVRFYGDDGNWRNRFLNSVTIQEEYIGSTNLFKGNIISEPKELYRIVVSVTEKPNREYTIKGLYKLAKERSSPHKRIYIKFEE